MRSISVGSIMFIVSTTQNFRGIHTPYSRQYAVFSGCRYCFYYPIRSIFEGWILLIISNAQYFGMVDLVYTERYADFLWSILLILRNTQCFEGLILLILGNTQIFSGDGYFLY